MSRILTQEEVNALLRGVADGEIEAGAARPPAAVRPLDLTSQERDVRGRLPGLEIVVERFVRALRGSLGTVVGRPTTVALRRLQLVKFGGVLDEIEQPVSLQVFRMTPLRGQGLVVLRGPLAATALELFLGGSPARQTALAAREFTTIEQRVLGRFCGRVLQDLAEAWKPLVAVETRITGAETDPRFATIAARDELVLELDVQVQVEGGEDGTLHLYVPDAALGPVRARLHATGAERDAPDGTWADRLRAVLGSVGLEVSAELGTRRLTLRQVLELGTGDVIPLATGREGPILVRVEGRPRFLGAPGVAGSANAVRVTARL